MDTYRTVLFLHLVSLGVGFSAAGALVLCLFQLRSATTLAEAVPWGVAAGRVEKAFPVAVVGLFATGAYMTSDVWTWSTGWIEVGIAGLIVVALQGPLLGGRSAKLLERALHENGPGPLGAHARAMTRQPSLWIAEFANIGVVLAIVWNMTQKPGTGEAIAVLVIGYVLGAALALGLTRAAGAEAAVAADTPG
jgi:prolipoprotein diacylglyceryltransferase